MIKSLKLVLAQYKSGQVRLSTHPALPMSELWQQILSSDSEVPKYLGEAALGHQWRPVALVGLVGTVACASALEGGLTAWVGEGVHLLQQINKQTSCEEIYQQSIVIWRLGGFQKNPLFLLTWGADNRREGLKTKTTLATSEICGLSAKSDKLRILYFSGGEVLKRGSLDISSRTRKEWNRDWNGMRRGRDSFHAFLVWVWWVGQDFKDLCLKGRQWHLGWTKRLVTLSEPFNNIRILLSDVLETNCIHHTYQGERRQCCLVWVPPLILD